MITKEFVTAGKAIFTLENSSEWLAEHSKAQPHYTYRVDKKEKDNGRDIYFVSLLTGPDNITNYTYLGLLNPANGDIILTANSKYNATNWPVRLLRRTLARVWQEEGDKVEEAGFALHHVGRCGRCGQPLTTPESIKTGIGPICAAKMFS